MQSPTYAHRGTFTEVTGRRQPYSVRPRPYRFSNADSGVQRPAPRQDEHTEEILAEWLGGSAPA